jgi:O-antigen/teichoic acid export membrane protein
VNFTLVKKNIIANFAGSGWIALLALFLIPVYIKFLGIEAWGVIGIFTSLQSLAYLMDLGLSVTLNREMARLSLEQDKAQEMRDLVRTFELIYWGFAVVIGAAIVGLAPLIANKWLRGIHLAPETIASAIMLMGLAITLQWPFVLYSGGLLGLQRQVLLSALNVGITTLRGAGAVLILWRVSPSLQAFFIWQVVMSLLQTFLARWFLWGSLPDAEKHPTFQRDLLQKRWQFAAGMSGIIVISLIITNMDKVILSRLLSLEMFGYYVLAAFIGTSLYLLVVPLSHAVTPRFIQLATIGDMEGLKEIYHHGCQVVSVLILPITVTIAFFSREVLTVWLGNPTTVDNTYLILSLLMSSTALSSLMHLPWALHFAFGSTKLGVYFNLVSLLVLVPLLASGALWYGAVGAALVWLLFNSMLVLVGIQLIHHRSLKGEQWRWFLEDVGLPMAVSLSVAAVCRAFLPVSGSRVQLLAGLAVTGFLVAGSTVLVTPVTRGTLISYFRSWRQQLPNPS